MNFRRSSAGSSPFGSAGGNPAGSLPDVLGAGTPRSSPSRGSRGRISTGFSEPFPAARRRRPVYELSFNETAAVLTIRAFGDDPEPGSLPYPEFLRNAFRNLEEKKISNLIIDLRGNGGGRDEYGKLLFAHVMDRPFLYYLSMEAKKDRYDLFRFTNEKKEDLEDLAKFVQKNDRGRYDLLGHPNAGSRGPSLPGSQAGSPS